MKTNGVQTDRQNYRQTDRQKWMKLLFDSHLTNILRLISYLIEKINKTLFCYLKKYIWRLREGVKPNIFNGHKSNEKNINQKLF